MINVLINCSNLTKGGGIQVAHSFLNQIIDIDRNKYIVVCSQALYDQLKRDEFNNRFKFFKYDIKASPINAILGKNKFLSSLVSQFFVDKVFTLFGPSYWKPGVFHVCGFAKPHYLYKDSPFFKMMSFKDMLILKLKGFFHLYDFKNNNDVLITENENVTEELFKIIEKKIYTVTNYYNQVFDNSSTNKVYDFTENKGLKLLTVSANYPHKNLKIIPSVIDYLIESHPSFNFMFILTIDESEMFVPNRMKKHIKFLGKVNIEDCPSLYNSCNFMFLPTLLECFSASYCEAMKMKKPILTSDLPFAHGICEESAIYFNPTSIESIGDKIYNLYRNKDKQEELIKFGIKRLDYFDNSKTRAEKYLNIIENETNYTRP
jgi:glycosyltransferase involved in cell wall biosynthesis